MDFNITEEQRAFVDSVRRVCQTGFKERALKYLDGTWPAENMKQLGEIGVLGMSVPQEYGGSGLGILDTVLVLEEIGKVCYVTAMAALGELGVQTRVISTYAPESIKRRILPRVATGEAILAICMTEPNAGTDVPSYTTNTEVKGERVIVNGVKTLISRADIAEMFVVFTRVNKVPGAKGIGCVLVPGGVKGLTARPSFHTMGGEYLSEVVFDNVEIPLENLVLKEDGMKRLLSAFNTQRCLNPAICLGLAEGALEEAVRYMRDRSAFGRQDRGFSGDALEGRRHVRADRGRARAPVSRRGERRQVPRPDARRDGQDLLQRDEHPRHLGGDSGPRRLRLHRRVPGVALLPGNALRQPGRRHHGDPAQPGRQEAGGRHGSRDRHARHGHVLIVREPVLMSATVPSRGFCARLAVLGVAACWHQAVCAADPAAGYPSRPVRLIVGQPPGGNADTTARVYAQKLGERFGMQFVVDNRGGAGGVIATELTVRAQPDGYTLFVAHTAVGTNPALIAKLPFDTRRDLAPISLMTVSPNIVVVAAANPIKSIGDLVAAARAGPGKINYASSGVATSTHVSGELFKAMAKVSMQHVAYKGAPASMIAVATGESEVSFAGMAGALPLVRGGRLRGIAVTGEKRFPRCPICRRSQNRVCPVTNRSRGTRCLRPRGCQSRSSISCTRRWQRSPRPRTCAHA